MAEEHKGIRLKKAATELNVGISTLVEFLARKGHVVETNPNTRLTADQYELVAAAFQAERAVKEQADRIEIAEKTRFSGAEVIKLKGATFDGIAVSVSTIAKSLLKGENTIRTVGSVLNGEYGIANVATNVPTIIGADGVEKVLELDLDPQELRFLQASAESVKKILSEVEDL